MSRLRYFRNPFLDLDKLQLSSSSPSEIWLDELKRDILGKCELVFKKSEGQNCDGGIYVGPAGVAYVYLHLTRNSTDFLTEQMKSKFMKAAQQELETHMRFYQRNKIQKLAEAGASTHYYSQSDDAGFLLGKAGVNAVGAVLSRLTGNEQQCQVLLKEYSSAATVCQELNFREGGSDELFVGRAGYLCGALWLQKILGAQPVSIDNLRNIWCAIIKSGKEYSKRHGSPSPLMYSYYGVEYLGAAHGLCSILQILLSFPEFLREYPDAEQSIKASINYYLTLQDKRGNFPCAMDEVRPGRQRTEYDDLLHWCHGAPGAIYLFAKAYLHYKEQKYLDACVTSGEAVWERGLLRKGPGLCHGISGNGYVFLVLHRLTGGGDPKYLLRAQKFYEFLSCAEFITDARTPDCPFSLYEGWAGTLCFMSDLLNPNNAEFPFFNIL